MAGTRHEAHGCRGGAGAGYAGAVNAPPVFNPFVPSYRKNPYLQLGRLRSGDPVHRSEALQAWVLTRYADCLRVLRDHEAFSSDARRAQGMVPAAITQQRAASPLGGEPTVLGTDPPGHTRLRGIVNRAFTPRAVEALRPRIEAIAASLLEQQPQRGGVDVMAALAQPLPVIVIAELLGVPAEDRERFTQWSSVIAQTTDLLPSEERMAAVAATTRELVDYFERFVAERERAPRDDLISTLLRAEEDGHRLTRNELLAFAILLLVAGNETTTHLIGNGMRALLAHPEALAALRARPEALPAAIEEMLRYDGPVQGLVRFVTADVEVGGRRLAAGDIVLCMLGGANRDPEQFPDAERFDIARAENRHLAFGHGIHYCVGAPLARVEAEIALRALLARWPSITPDGEAELGGTFLIRGPRRLPIAVAR